MSEILKTVRFEVGKKQPTGSIIVKAKYLEAKKSLSFNFINTEKCEHINDIQDRFKKIFKAVSEAWGDDFICDNYNRACDEIYWKIKGKI